MRAMESTRRAEVDRQRQAAAGDARVRSCQSCGKAKKKRPAIRTEQERHYLESEARKKISGR